MDYFHQVYVRAHHHRASLSSVASTQCGSRPSAWGLHSNKKDLIASNDKADTKAPDAIIKSGLINQTRV